MSEYSRLSVIPLITQSCLDVVTETSNEEDYFIGKIDWIMLEQPVLFAKLVSSAHSIADRLIEDKDSDEYGYVVTNCLCMAIQTYIAIDKQIGVQMLEDM